ncbi:uncharacterized protein LOC116429795 [Nomia melanderi]|uniref:uncharacterized protein LOC116429795 n=1 Tax=Nomia melanderi TaxID=2448451 RepID=UPI0013044D02|nr:hybrid signal transduction histidine kinase M-like [Nomia melanderi]
MASKNKNLKLKTKIFDFDSDDSCEFIIPFKKMRKGPVEETQIQLSSKLNDNNSMNKVKHNIVLTTNRDKFENTERSNLLKLNKPKVNESQNVEVINNRNESQLNDNVNSNLIESSKSKKQSLVDLPRNNISQNDKTEIMHNQEIQSENNVDGYTSNILENKVKFQKALNFKAFVVKIMNGLKRTLFKFILQMNHLQQKILKDEIVSQQDANNLVFIISCVLSKLREEINEKEKNFTNLSKLEETIISTNLNKNDSQLQNMVPSSFNNSHFFKKPFSIVKKTVGDNINHVESNCTQLNSNDGKKKDNLPLRISITSTPTSQNCKTDTSIWNNQSFISILSRLKEITIIKKPVEKPIGNSKSTENNKMNMDIVNQKQINQYPVRIGSPKIVIADHTVTTKQASMKNKRTLNRTSSLLLDCDNPINNNVNNKCSITNLYPVRSHHVQQSYKNKTSIINTDMNEDGRGSRSLPSSNYSSDDQTVCNLQSTNLHHCNVHGAITIDHTNNFFNEHSTNKNSTENVQMDQEILSLSSNDSSIFSAYIIPTELNKLSKNYSRKMSLMTVNNNRNKIDKKLLMTCKVLVEKHKI